MKQYYATGLVCILALCGVVYYTYIDTSGVRDAADNLGTYTYNCVGGSTVTMTPATDMSQLDLANVPGTPAAFRVVRTNPHTGEAARYEGDGVVFTASGEHARIERAGISLECDPVQREDMAPFNWGDPVMSAAAPL